MVGRAAARVHPVVLPRERGATLHISILFASKWLKPRPESGLDCLICAELARVVRGAATGEYSTTER